MGSPLVQSLQRSSNICKNRIKILSPAKLNLYLNILGKYPSGYHEIESIVERVSICDHITIEPTKDPSIRLTCDKKDLETPDNLCVKAAELAQKTLKLPFGFKIDLVKRIPVGAGMGGGSTNAASVLLALDTLLGLKLSLSRLYSLGEQLGSDVNFFLSQSRFAIIRGRGERVEPFEGKTLYHRVVWPGIMLSTKRVYLNTNAKLTKFIDNVKIIQHAIKRGDAALLRSSIFNALEKSALSECVRLQKAKAHLNAAGGPFRVTGSGSALYSVEDCNAGNFKGPVPANWLALNVHTL